MPYGRYRFGNEHDGEWFDYDGQVGRTLDGMGLASSASGLDHMIRIMLRATDAPLHEIIRMASLTPAELTGIADCCGSLDVGKQADLVLLDSKLKPRRVFIGGIEMDL
jgi:N-acetylglucosamine-6-phosphate deacetylase